LNARVLTADQIHRLRKSFIHVERQSHVAALVFYQRLFELDPTLRALFKTDIELQAQKLLDMLAAALSLLERPGELTSTLEDLGARHAGYGVKEEHYATVGTALLAMLESVLTKEFTPETRLAWTDLYALIAGNMLRGAAHAAH
jgi:hemoglobin-like flavoprotein